MEFTPTPPYLKDLKKLSKKYKTLPQDLQIFEQLLTANISQIILASSNHHALLHADRERSLFIIRSRLHCRTLKRASLRIIYQYQPVDNRVTYIELYFKGDRVLEDTGRWQAMLNY